MLTLFVCFTGYAGVAMTSSAFHSGIYCFLLLSGGIFYYFSAYRELLWSTIFLVGQTIIQMGRKGMHIFISIKFSRDWNAHIWTVLNLKRMEWMFLDSSEFLWERLECTSPDLSSSELSLPSSAAWEGRKDILNRYFSNFAWKIIIPCKTFYKVALNNDFLFLIVI
jgi:hypothetical protein